jgi:selenocysteine lyase/cysteine desulfurase
MNLQEILTNESLRNHEFPVTREKVFLAHAGVCPLPRRVADAISKYAAAATLGDQEALVADGLVMNTRKLAAQMIGAKPEEIALVGPTSLALSYVASGLNWRKGDNIVIYFDDYPSNVYPWMALAERGVEVRLLNIREYGRIRAMDVIGQVDENTKMVALASNHFVAGYRLDLNAIGKALHERRILFCVDGIQSLGAFPTRVDHVDFLAADAHKWLLGPLAAGVFYVRKDLHEKFKPPIYGWHNVRCPNYVAQEQIVYPPDARRYEAGSENFMGLVGLHASMEMLLEIGIENIAAELLRKRQLLVPALQSKGYTVMQADAPKENSSSITSFYREGAELGALHALHTKLESAGIITSLRANRTGQQFIRVSPHFYNTDAELHRLLELV